VSQQDHHGEADVDERQPGQVHRQPMHDHRVARRPG
jgi:hypothetical protein